MNCWRATPNLRSSRGWTCHTRPSHSCFPRRGDTANLPLLMTTADAMCDRSNMRTGSRPRTRSGARRHPLAKAHLPRMACTTAPSTGVARGNTVTSAGAFAHPRLQSFVDAPTRLHPAEGTSGNPQIKVDTDTVGAGACSRDRASRRQPVPGGGPAGHALSAAAGRPGLISTNLLVTHPNPDGHAAEMVVKSPATSRSSHASGNSTDIPQT